MARSSRLAPGSLRGRVKPRDPFELIRWLALSQPDPRKALAELVQNSLDAGARRITVQRVRFRSVPCLRILDDGEGVIPDLPRPEALRYIATNIGHSRKQHLSPEQRLQLMTQGQYGIGLLGFWSLGQTLEMRSSIPGQRAHRLILKRDRPEFVVEPLKGRLLLDERWTEVIVTDLHRESSTVVSGRRAADYLAAELRGQLLARRVELAVLDRMARGRAPKEIRVRPPRFLGERIEGLPPLMATGHGPVRVELYWQGAGGDGAEPHGIGIYAAGTLVAGSFQELGALDLDRSLWTDGRLTGMIDFPGFRVAPGSRRGIVPDAAAEAFAAAIRSLEPALLAILERFEHEQEVARDRTLIRDLQRAFRDFYRRRPQFAMLPVEDRKDAAVGPGETGPEGGPEGREEPPPGAGLPNGGPEAASSEEEAPLHLLPPGPLAAVEVRPKALRIECLQTRAVTARGVDTDGRPVDEPVAYRWEIAGPIGEFEDDAAIPGRGSLIAGSKPGDGTIRVIASAGGRQAEGEIPVNVLEELDRGRSDEGIPDPEFVHQPGAPWRSRMQDGRWQVNTGHPDYRAVQDRPALKLRYLAGLFAKEVVMRSHQDPRLGEPLEQLVEIAAYADLRLTQSRGPRKGSTPRRGRQDPREERP